MTKKVTLGIIAIAIILIGIVFWSKTKSPKTTINTQKALPAATNSQTAAKTDKNNSAKSGELKTPAENTSATSSNYANASGSVTAIDPAQKSLTIKTDDGKTLTLKYTDKTTIYKSGMSGITKDNKAMQDNKPQVKTAGDIVNGSTVRILYDSTNNSAISIMIL